MSMNRMLALRRSPSAIHTPIVPPLSPPPRQRLVVVPSTPALNSPPRTIITGSPVNRFHDPAPVKQTIIEKAQETNVEKARPVSEKGEVKSLKPIFTENAMKPIGPYSQAILVPASGQLLFLSGQLPAYSNGEMLAKDAPIRSQTAAVIMQINAILESAGSNLDKIIKVNIFLTEMSDFAEMNGVYEQFITHKPARSCVAVKELPRGVKIEIECIAMV